MFGVLVCEDEEGQLGFLAAYSGQIGGCEDWPWFVPAVFDYLQPDGYFKQEEARITAINHQVNALEASSNCICLKDEVLHLKEQASKEIEAYKIMIFFIYLHLYKKLYRIYCKKYRDFDRILEFLPKHHF